MSLYQVFSGRVYPVIFYRCDNNKKSFFVLHLIYTRVASLLAYKYPRISIEPFLELVTIYSKMFPNIILPRPISRDPDNDKFITCAISANAKIIISGDKNLLDVGAYEDIRILSPRDFVNSHFKF